MERPLVAVPAAVAARSRVIAIVQAAGRRIGIDGEHVVQAVVVPPHMAAVPRRAGGIVGVVMRGEQMVPVVRLETWLEAGADGATDAPPPLPETSAESRIVILGDGERVVGLLVEAVIGMQRCAASAVARLFHDDRADELFAGAVRVDADTAPIALLEPSRLARLAGVWCAAAGMATQTRARPGSAEGAVHDEASTTRVDLAVFRIGDVLVGLDVVDIGELMPTPALRPPPLRHPSTRGLCEWRDRVLPVVDIAGLLGARPESGNAPWMCVVRHGELALGVLVDEICELDQVALSDAEAGADALVRGERPIARGILQVLGTAALMAACPESRMGLRRGERATQAGAANSPDTWLVFDCGGSYATRIASVQEIVPLPETLRPRLGAGLAVSLEWRGHAVPVRALSDDVPALAPEAARLLVIVVVGSCRVAIPIVGVKAMIAPRTGSLARLRARSRMVDVISTVTGDDRATYEIVDLEARARGPGTERAAA